MKRYYQKGYTLLELMLVIALMAVIAMAGLATLQSRTQTIKIDKAAIEMQHWLEAGMGYFVDKQEWPSSISEIVSKGYMPDGSSGPDGPNGNNKNPWGYPYQIKTIGRNLFAVSTVTPQFKAKNKKSNHMAIAKRVASRLPNAYASLIAEEPTVVATVTVPGQVRNASTVISVATVESNKGYVEKPICAPGKHAKFDIAISAFTPPNSGGPVKLRSVTTTYTEADNKIYPKIIMKGGASLKNGSLPTGYEGTLLVVSSCVVDS